MEQTQQTVSPMSNAGRNTYVREHLLRAMLELLAEKPLGEISVSELCGRAGVGRTSFYRNFETKEEIVKGHIHRLLFTELATAAEHQPLDKLILQVFSHFRAHEGFYRLLGERGLVYLLKEVLLTLCGYAPAQPKLAAYASAFAAYSLYGWIEVWFQRGMRESPEELAELFRGQGAG